MTLFLLIISFINLIDNEKKKIEKGLEKRYIYIYIYLYLYKEREREREWINILVVYNDNDDDNLVTFHSNRQAKTLYLYF